MPRRTAKYLAALKALKALPSKLNIARAKAENLYSSDELYATLAKVGMCWDSKAGEWRKTNRPVLADGSESVSEFTDDYGKPSGIVHLRLMGHPDDIKRFKIHARKLLTGAEVSEPYENRKGAGVRVYVTLNLRIDDHGGES